MKSPEPAERDYTQKTVEKVSMINLERVEMVKANEDLPITAPVTQVEGAITKIP